MKEYAVNWPSTITQSELASLLNLTPRHIRNLTGPVFRTIRKEWHLVSYPFPESIHSFISYREDLVRNPLDHTIITQPDLANCLGITPRQVRNLTGSVFRIVQEDGNTVFYPLHESIRAFLAYRERMVSKRCRKIGREAMDSPSQHPP